MRPANFSKAFFSAIMYYCVIPASSIFMAICAIGANAFAIKGISLMLTGSLSLHKYPLPESLLVSPFEMILGIALSIVQALLMALYAQLTRHQHQKRLLPFDPLEPAHYNDDNNNDDESLVDLEEIRTKEKEEEEEEDEIDLEQIRDSYQDSVDL